MVLGFGNKCIKFLVFFFNFLVFAVGAAIFAVALSVILDKNARQFFQDIIYKADPASKFDLSQINIPLYVLAAIGGLLLLTGFLGCCGACVENTCLLGLFFAIILILFVAELACGIAVLVNKNKVKDGLFKGMTDAVQKYNDKDPKYNDLRQAIDKMQNETQCCGCNNRQDYGGDAPPSCKAYEEGCCTKLWNELESKAGLVGGIAIGILVVELLAMIFSCILCQAFKRGDYQYA